MNIIKLILVLFILTILQCNIASAASDSFERRDDVVSHMIMELPHYVYIDQEDKNRSLCIIGAPTIYERITSINESRKIFKYIFPSVDDASLPCTYVYAPQTIKARELLGKGLPRNTLLISSYPTFINEGGPVAFADDNGRVGIYLNLTAIKQQSFFLNPDIIELSKKVIQ